MDRDYYRDYYLLERTYWGFLARKEIIRSQIARAVGARRDLSILNIGTATGATSEMLEEFGRVKSIEYDAECCECVKERLCLDIEQGNILELKQPSAAYDLVCAFDVVEHVQEDRRAIEEMIRVCKPNGLIVATVPAFMCLWGPHDEVNHHYRRYRISELESLFPDSAEVVFKSYFNSILFVPIFLVKKLRSLFSLLSRPKAPTSDFAFCNSAVLGKLLYHIYLLERPLLKAGFAFPFGVSAIVCARVKL